MQQDETFTFGRFEIHRRRRELLADGEPVELGSRAFDILFALIEADGTVVTKSELMDLVWPGTAVEESNLSVQIHALRRALGEDRKLIQTVAGRGYRFVGELGTAAGAQAENPTVPGLSIVVLPFTNLSDDPEQQYFADGITEDLTTDLSRLADITVISRQTAFVYRNKPADMRQIGRELRVRYVLDGSARRLGNRIRVNAQLIDAETDSHLWADRFDGDADDLFGLQNEITSRIAISLDLELARAEAERPTIRPDALDYIRRGRALYLGCVPTRQSHAEQIALFERALALDPTSMKAQCFLAAALTSRVQDQMTDSAVSDIARAEELASRALTAFPYSALPHFAKAQVLRAQNRPRDAIPEYETVIALNRNWVSAIAALGFCKLMTGSIEEAIPAQERAIRLDPRGPLIWLYYFWIGQVHLLQSRVDEAIPWLEKARSANPEHPLPHAYLASGYAFRDEAERAEAELGEARRLSGDDRYAAITRLRSVGFFGVPKIRALFEATYLVGLRKAGMPD
jgi:TolB-like protein/cytochrome c-type biogenesis protein CcmH/NrfG